MISISYARYSEGDVYLIATPIYFNEKDTGELQLCCYGKEHEIFCTKSGREMLKHLDHHKKLGHKVPIRAFTRLEYEIEQGEWA